MIDFACSLTKECCPVCGKLHDGPLVMNKWLTPLAASKVRELQGKVVGFNMCPECQGGIDKGGVWLIEVDPTKMTASDKTASTLKQEEAYRTGRAWCLKREVAEQIFDRVSDVQFVDPEVIAALGLDKVEPTEQG